MSDTAPEAITAFHVMVEIFRELEGHFGPEFGTAVRRRVEARRQHMLDGDSIEDGEALTEGMEWLEGMLKHPSD